jgi:Ser/Thr protein kinase RdoA (MazF antagonist)
LAAYPLEVRVLSATELGSAGGFSGARLWRIEASGEPLCLRRWPAEYPSRQRLEQIHAVLLHVARQGFSAAPVPRATRDGPTVVDLGGHLWELTSWMPGKADYGDHPSHARLSAALRALAQFHRAAATCPGLASSPGVSPGIAARRQQLQQLVAGGASQIERAMPQVAWPQMTDAARRWLALLPQAASILDPALEAAARIDVPLQPCLRDIWHDHVLFTGDEVSGIVDFGAMRQECVAGDIARLLGSLVQDDAVGWRSGIAAYESVRALSSEERILIAAFDASGVVLSPANWFRWIFLEGRTFADRGVVVARVEAQLKRLAHWLQSQAVIWP